MALLRLPFGEDSGKGQKMPGKPGIGGRFSRLDSSRPLDAETRFAHPAQAYGAFCLVKRRSRFRPAPVKRFRAMNERWVSANASRISAFNRIAS
jgi:hypothetical protein